MLQKSLNPTALLILTFLLLNLSCCDDCPTCSEPEVEKAYYVYIADDESTDPFIRIVNSKTDSVIDSIQIEGQRIGFLETTTDGKYLALAQDSIHIMDTDNREIVATLPNGYPFDFSYDNQYLLIYDQINGLLYKYITPSWTSIGIDTLPFSILTLFNNGYYLLGGFAGATEYAIYNYENSQIIKSDTLKRSDGSVLQYNEITISHDDKYIYFSSQPDKLFKYDIENNLLVDSVLVFFDAMYGQLKNSHNGQYLLFSEVAGWPNPFPYGTLLIVKQVDFTVNRRISTIGLDPQYLTIGVDIGGFEITPDDRKVFTYKSMLGFAPAISIDIEKNIGTLIKGFPENQSSMSVAIGKEIK